MDEFDRWFQENCAEHMCDNMMPTKAYELIKLAWGYRRYPIISESEGRKIMKILHSIRNGDAIEDD